MKNSENAILRIINGFDIVDYPGNGDIYKNLYILSTGAGLGMAACDILFAKYLTKFNLKFKDLGGLNTNQIATLVDYTATYFNVVLLFWLSITNIKPVFDLLKDRNHTPYNGIILLKGLNNELVDEFAKIGYQKINDISDLKNVEFK